MLLSLRELVVWTGLGPFEVSIHSFSLAVFTLLVTLRAEGVFSPPWHILFSPLYVALGLTAYYDAILYIRMFSFAWKKSRRPILYMLLTSVIGLGLLLATEYNIAEFLDGRAESGTLVTFLCLIFLYLLARMPLAFKALSYTYSF